MQHVKKFVSVLVLLSTFSFSASSQCKSLVKKNISRLAPFTHNGQLNSATLPEGGVVDFKITCYTGLTYRLVLAAEANLGKVTFRVLDEDNNEVYNSTESNATSWDFNVGSSQDLTVEISVPLSDKSIKGCVGLIVGFREQAKIGALRPM
jgi:hypothetical protein